MYETTIVGITHGSLMHFGATCLLYSFQWTELLQYSWKWPVGWFNIKECHLTSIGNPIVEIRWSSDRLISTMGFPILVTWLLSNSIWAQGQLSDINPESFRVASDTINSLHAALFSLTLNWHSLVKLALKVYMKIFDFQSQYQTCWRPW